LGLGKFFLDTIYFELVSLIARFGLF